MINKNKIHVKINIEDFNALAEKYAKDFTGVELCLTDSVLFMDDYNLDLNKLDLFQSKIIHLPFYGLQLYSKDSSIREISKKIIFRGIDVASNLKIPKGVFHPAIAPMIPAKGRIKAEDFMIEFLDELIAYGKKKNVKILAENTWEYERNFFLKLKENRAKDDFGFCLDVAHVFCFSDRNFPEWLEVFGDYLDHIHLSDNDFDEDSHYSLGEGKIPFKDLDLPKDLTYTLEVNHSEFYNSVSFLKENNLIG